VELAVSLNVELCEDFARRENHLYLNNRTMPSVGNTATSTKYSKENGAFQPPLQFYSILLTLHQVVMIKKKVLTPKIHDVSDVAV
jgi:hypothetical protein